MKAAKEIRASLESIKFYISKIKKLTKEQFEADTGLKDMNTQVGSVRFGSMGNIEASCTWIETYCHNIEANLKVAVDQGYKLTSEEEEEYYGKQS